MGTVAPRSNKLICIECLDIPNKKSSNSSHSVDWNQGTSHFSNKQLYRDGLCISNHILNLSLMKYLVYFHLQSQFNEVAPSCLTTTNGTAVMHS